MAVSKYNYDIPYKCRGQNAESLFTLCTRVVALNIVSHLVVAQSLPGNVKNVLVTLLGRRGLLTGPVLRSLIHVDLKSLDLTGSKVRDSTVRILQSLTKLSSLLIPGNEVSTLGLVQLFPYLPHLEELDLSNSKVDDEVLISLTNSCPKLRVIILRKCPSFTDRGFKFLATELYNILVLDVGYTKVTDDGLAALSRGPSRHKLKELNIDGCQQLTSSCGSHLDAFPSISELSFNNCPLLLANEWFLSFSCDKMKTKLKNISFTIE
ncbi:F-box/LRR-repeat protein 2-like isoform X1 [Daphnia pulex]|uniref:F-box/LRR-repeat protein 2-like isoform X1 n=1 Tax=Daphnia pulex TaxID=6669 RepID=UPI001EDDA060|nr:F-box/LRR-repeat protein 2-like isoform X1 [Daphnia pulex]